jgi:3-oxoacyl-[acyl-carrier-protein] synthase-3
MVFLKAFGRYLPERVITNKEMGLRIGKEAAWIEQVSGIAERRFAAPEETVVDLAMRAGKNCMEQCAGAGEGIGMLIVASGTGSRRFPGPAAMVSHGLGLDGVPALDLPMASAGSLFGLCVAARFAPSCRNVLVIAAEKMSEVSLRDPVEPGTAALFGDGAGACIVSGEAGIAEILDFTIHSEGSFAEDLRLEFGGPVMMNGRSVILQASRKLPRAIGDVLEQTGIPPAKVGAFILHQANRNLLAGVARALSVPENRFYSNISRYGNTSSASMLIAASEWNETAGFQPGRPVVFAGFGAGFHWGAMVVMGTGS